MVPSANGFIDCQITGAITGHHKWIQWPKDCFAVGDNILLVVGGNSLRMWLDYPFISLHILETTWTISEPCGVHSYSDVRSLYYNSSIWMHIPLDRHAILSVSHIAISWAWEVRMWFGAIKNTNLSTLFVKTIKNELYYMHFQKATLRYVTTLVETTLYTLEQRFTDFFFMCNFLLVITIWAVNVTCCYNLKSWT